MKRRNNPSDSGMMGCPSSFILGILMAVHYSGNLLLPVAANCSLLPHTNNNIHLHQHHQHLPWRRRRGGAVRGISRSSLSFIHSIRGGGNDGGTRVLEEYDDISEDDSFAIEGSQTDGHASTIISPDATIDNKSINNQSTKVQEETDEEVEKSEEGANETINVVKKDGTLQPLDREKVSSFISCYVED
jgi:hypothetical protein